MSREIGPEFTTTMTSVTRLSEREHRSLVIDYNSSAAPYPADKTIVELFEAQAERTPDDEAVRHGNQALSYSRLNERANQLAQLLRTLGAGPDGLVTLYMEHSIEVVCAILGVLKCGAAYVPVDPATTPKERLAFILQDISEGTAGAQVLPVLITQSELVNNLPRDAAEVVTLGSDFARLESYPNSNPKGAASPRDLAYVIYTSGSTGKPKGVLIEHRSLVNYIWWANQQYCQGERLTWPLFSSLAFDLTVTSIFTPLISGGCIVVYREDPGVHGMVVLKVVEDGAVDIVKLTPSHLAMIKDMDLGATRIRKFIVGGEDFKTELARDITKKFGRPVEIYNEYGPTEATVGCMIHRFDAERDRGLSVPIGIPAANAGVYILDEYLNPVPSGVIGEMYLAGDGLARGYLNRPQLTEQKFLAAPDPRQNGPAVQYPFSKPQLLGLYKTGDLARWSAEGRMEFLGRVDFQVKIGGMRIEMGEIEARLLAHPEIHECIVDVVRSGAVKPTNEDHETDQAGVKDSTPKSGRAEPPAAEPGIDRLVAYYSSEKPLTVAEVRAHLAKALPDYMVPHYVVWLQKLPLTPNGKVDRKSLPIPTREHMQPTQEFVRPQTETEKALALIWSELLKVDNIGILDEFFNLGGHSLLAIRAVSRIRDVFGVELSLQTLFESRTIAGLATALSAAKSSGAVQRIERRKPGDPTPLSFAQEQLWFLDQLVPASPVYNMGDIVDFYGNYNGVAMRKAIQELVRRHEILRTTFAHKGGEPVQIIAPEVELPLPELDLSSLSQLEREREWTRVLREQGRKPFDLSQGPLLRASIVHLSSNEHRLLLTTHHILADEWSMEVVHQEIRQLYGAFSEGRPSPLPELPIQYGDFVRWQRDWLQGEVLESQTTYWNEELAGAPFILELPTDKPRPATQSFRGATEIFQLPGNLRHQLKTLAREQQATLFMMLGAAFMALLHRYTGQDDIVVGTPISGRTHSETENLIGLFLNTVPLRAKFSERQDFLSLLQQVRERALGAYAHPDVPLEHLVAEFEPERDPSRMPLFQVVFILHNSEGVSQVSKVSGNQELETGTSKFDLTLVLSENERGLDGLIEYSTDLFEAATIRRLASYYARLLKAIVDDPDRNIAALPLLTDGERQQLLTDWNNTAVEFPERTVCLHQLIEEQAVRTPDRVALVFEREKLTYGELNRRASQLANHLTKLGVGCDVLVGLYVERSLEMVVGILGILKAGGAYVPMDPSFPHSRLNYMVEDSKMSVLVTHRGLEEKLQTRPSSIVRLDSDWSEISKLSSDSAGLPLAVRHNRAYVLYTSGSTGKPKGVEIPHSAIVNFLLSMRHEPGFRETDTLLAVTTLSFDIAGLEIYLPLMTGGRVVIASREDTQDPVRLMKRMEESRCTVMQATPATWRTLIQAGWSGSPNLKVLCGGEALLGDLAEELLARCAELWNMYGPTETTVWSAVHKVNSGSGSVPIGKPIANTQLYVLNAQRGLIPQGAIGELYIGGEGLAHGYLHRDELTRQRFVASPFAPNVRLYRTGDLARWLPGGVLECLGRVDTQVKIRGFRIELGEIDAVLSLHPAIQQCATIAREDLPGDKQLVAYFEARSGQAPTPGDLRAQLEKYLPAYMIPSVFVAMERLPLTPNGKIDRKALPAPAQSAVIRGEFVTPRDPVEQMLAGIWSEVLKVKRVGRHDNFFELGGHSLLAVQVVVEIEKVTKFRLPLAMLLQAPSIAELAELLRRENWTPSWSCVVPIRPAGSKPPLFLVHAAEGNVLLYRALASHLESDQPVYGLQSTGLDGKSPIDRSFERAAERYVAELRQVQPRGPYLLGGYCLGGTLALEMARQLIAAGETVAFVGMIETFNMCSIRWPLPAHKRFINRFVLNPYFHLRNLLAAGGEARWSFFREKFRVEVSRAKVSVRITWTRLAQRLGLSSSQELHHLKVADIYEHALAEYQVKPYPGKITVFRPSTHMAGFSDKVSGWADVAHGGVQLFTLPNSPRASLVEPFVGELARLLSGCIDRAIKGAESC